MYGFGMHRPKRFEDTSSPDKHKVVARAMSYFWREGFYANSVDDIASEIGIHQNSLYTEFNGRQGLFIAAMRQYSNDILMHEFHALETELADAKSIALYLQAQVNKAVEVGLPGMGCFLTNTILKTSPRNRIIRDVTDECLFRLRRGFENALTNEARKRGLETPPIKQLVAFLTTSTIGLWIYARHTEDPADLQKYRGTALHIMEEKLALDEGETPV